MSNWGHAPGKDNLKAERVKRFQIACEHRKTSPTAALAAVGGHRSTWSQYQYRSRNPEWNWWRPLADHLRVNVRWLLDGEGPMVAPADAAEPSLADLPLMGGSGEAIGVVRLPVGTYAQEIGGERLILAPPGQLPQRADLALVMLRSGGPVVREVVTANSKGGLVLSDPDRPDAEHDILSKEDYTEVRVVLGELYC